MTDEEKKELDDWEPEYVGVCPGCKNKLKVRRIERCGGRPAVFRVPQHYIDVTPRPPVRFWPGEYYPQYAFTALPCSGSDEYIHHAEIAPPKKGMAPPNKNA